MNQIRVIKAKPAPQPPHCFLLSGPTQLGTRVPFSRGETAICGSTGSTKSFIVVIQTMLVANVSVHHQRTQTFCLTLTLANTHFFIALLVCVIE